MLDAIKWVWSQNEKRIVTSAEQYITEQNKTRTVTVNNHAANDNLKVTRLPANGHRNSERCVGNHVQIKWFPPINFSQTFTKQLIQLPQKGEEIITYKWNTTNKWILCVWSVKESNSEINKIIKSFGMSARKEQSLTEIQLCNVA